MKKLIIICLICLFIGCAAQTTPVQTSETPAKQTAVEDAKATGAIGVFTTLLRLIIF